MQSVYRNFYRQFYMRTGGFIPTKPLNQQVYPGDFFQVRNGEMVMLGNIFRGGLIHRDDAGLLYGTGLNPLGWHCSDGVSKPYSGRGSGQGALTGDFQYSKQVLAFEKAGSFLFKGTDPQSVRMGNWNAIRQSLIIHLTQTHYSFRELYLVTEVATAADWTLVIAGSDKAELEIATDKENFGLVDIFGHTASRTIQSKDIECYHREPNRKPGFFRAKKLTVQEEQTSVWVSERLNLDFDQHEWAAGFFDDQFYHEPVSRFSYGGPVQASVLDLLRANELNPNTALLYFGWADANLDDVEKLFQTYEQ
jgi:hypothetical protein